MVYSHIIIHYDEIALKGKNRPFFERVLKDNIKELARNVRYAGIYKEGRKMIMEISDRTELEKMKKMLKNICGISNFSPAVSTDKDLAKIKEKTVELLDSLALTRTKKTFKIEARRSDKKFELTSPQINQEVGEYVLKNTALKVDVHSPDIEIVIDIGHRHCYIYLEKIKCVGGLPVGTAGKLIGLISGGIDSPVASFMMMKRGAKIVFVHFKNRTITSSGAGEYKVETLIKILSRFQGKSKLYIVPFEEFQKEIVAKIPAKNRMIIYRRIMFTLSKMIAEKEKAKGFVTGDSLSQVASQTIENIKAIYDAADYPVFAPLIGMNKQETIDLARSIGTYETSVLPYQDCCSFFIAKHPETKADLGEILEQEKKLDIDKTAKRVIADMKPKIICADL